MSGGDARVQRHLGNVPIDDLVVSPHNPRRTRDPEHISALAEHIRERGYDPERAVKAHRGSDGCLLVLAGETRRQAARQAGLTHVPVVEYLNYDDSELWQLAHNDNVADGLHQDVSITDLWADIGAHYATGMTMSEIANALGIDKGLVSRRCKWHESLPTSIREAVERGLLDEGHLAALDGVSCDVTTFGSWLTSERAQVELIGDLIYKHRGSSVGKKPSVRNVRAKAQQWKDVIGAAEQAHRDLEGDDRRWQRMLVDGLAAEKARSLADVNRVAKSVVEARLVAAHANEHHDADLRAEADRRAEIDAQVNRILLGDARERIHEILSGISLLVTDPPYGRGFHSSRRGATPRRAKIANDSENAITLLQDVVTAAYDRMADDAHVLVFTSFTLEPEFRRVIEHAGFRVLGGLVWVKGNHGLGSMFGGFAPKHERIIHAVKGKPKLRTRINDVLDIDEPRITEHPTEKPVALLRALIEATTDPGDVVLDPFAGSGSTVRAAIAAGRDCYGIEVDLQWHTEIAVWLYEQATRTPYSTNQASAAKTNQTLDVLEVEKERGVDHERGPDDHQAVDSHNEQQVAEHPTWSALRTRLKEYLAPCLYGADGLYGLTQWGCDRDIDVEVDIVRDLTAARIRNATRWTRRSPKHSELAHACKALGLPRPTAGKPVDLAEARKQMQRLARDYHASNHDQYQRPIDAFVTLLAAQTGTDGQPRSVRLDGVWQGLKNTLEAHYAAQLQGIANTALDDVRMLRERFRAIQRRTARDLEYSPTRRRLLYACDVLELPHPKAGSPLNLEMVRKQYHGLSREHHPDRTANEGDEQRRINDAYEWIKAFLRRLNDVADESDQTDAAAQAGEESDETDASVEGEEAAS